MAQRVAGVWRPLRFLATATIWIALLVAYANVVRSLEVIGVAAVVLIGCRLLHAVRWPGFDRYIKLISPVAAPKKWREMAATDSQSHIVWTASRPTIERWVEGRQSRGHRAAAARYQLGLAGQYRSIQKLDRIPNESGRALMRDISGVSVSDFADITAEIGELLTRDELRVARQTGLLPAWYWHSLSEAYARALK